MAEYAAPVKDMQFVLEKVVGLAEVNTLPGWEDVTPDIVEAVLGEAARFAEEVLSPLNASGDKQGVRLTESGVVTAPGFKEAYWKFAEGGWGNVLAPSEYSDRLRLWSRLRRCARDRQRHRLPGADQFETAVEVFDDGGATIDPVAAVGIGQPVPGLDRRAVDMAADHAIETARPDGVDHRVLEAEDEGNGTLDTALRIAGQRPVAWPPQESAQAREQRVGAHERIVADIAENRQPAVMACHLIELVAVQEQEATAVGGDVDVLLAHENLAEGDPVVLAQRFVVVARNQHDMLTVSRATQNLLHDRILCRRPVDAATHHPEVYDVANQVQILRLVLAEKLQQTLGLTAAGAKMDVRDEDRAHFHGRSPCGNPRMSEDLARAGRTARLSHDPPARGVAASPRLPLRGAIRMATAARSPGSTKPATFLVMSCPPS